MGIPMINTLKGKQMNINEILSKLPQDVLESTLAPEERAFLAKETMKLDNLVPEDLELEQANILGLRIFSLLTGVEAGNEEDLSTELQALSHFEDKELIGLLKKLVKLDCYKLRKRKATSDEADNEESSNFNPLTSL